MPDAKAQGFFEGLPPDGFLSSEEELREVWNLWMGRIYGWMSWVGSFEWPWSCKMH